MIATLLRSAKQAAAIASRLHRLNIGPRLTLCFMLIILALFAGNAVLLWQFQQARRQADRLSGVDQELIVVLQGHISLMSFYERLDVLADSKDSTLLLKQVETIHKELLQDTRRSQNTLSRLPPEVELDPTLLPTLLATQGELPAQLEAIAILAKSGDWDAVRLRLANQVRPLESTSSELVENIDREVGEQRRQAVLNIRQAQRRILLILPVTAAMTLLFAAFLGLVITRSITQPLRRLMEGSKALSRGDFSHRVPATGNDEITQLGSVFNDMIVRLQRLYRELQSRETYLAEAQKLSHTGNFGWDLSSGEIYWSAETFRIFEFDPKEKVTLASILERSHPQDRSTLQQLIEQVSRDRTPFDVEHRLLMPGGSVKYLRIVGRPSTDGGERSQFVGAVTDITERKRVEEALRRSESYLAEAQKLTHTASWVWEVEQRKLVYLSHEWYRIYGFEPADGMPAWERRLQRVHPADRAKWSGAIEQAIQNKSEYDIEFRVMLPDGTIKSIHTVGHPSLNTRGDLVQFVGSSTDITQRKEAELALRRSEAYLTEAQRISRTGSWAWNVRTGELFWSQEIFRIYGYDPETTKPTWCHILDRVHPEDRPGIEQRAKIEMTQKESVDFEGDFRIVLADESIKYLHTIAHPVIDETGEVTEVIGTVMDVTERRRADQERERLRQALADLAHITRVTTMGELTASLAHEIKQPIAAAVTDAKTCLRWLGRNEPDLGEAREAGARVIKDVTRASDIISRIGLLFKKGAPQRELLDINEVIQEMIVLLRSEASRYSISIRSELARNLPKAMADRVQLQQVLMNLMLNGIEAMKDLMPTGELTLSSRFKDGHLVISVSDTGVGLPPDKADQIFNPFFTTKPQGTGMGLTISRSIIESHGGRLSVTTLASGTTFQFTLPGEASAHKTA